MVTAQRTGKLVSLPSIMYQKEITKIMRNDSCRKCGGMLEANKKCNICNKANEFFCHKCGNITIEQIHSQCVLKDSSYKLLESPIQ